jgi:hypothetical protein
MSASSDSDHEDMTHGDFVVGLTFWTDTGEWLCTDIGSRVIVAIKVNNEDPSWNNGPPYAAVETVFDEFDFGGCFRTEADLRANRR